MKRRLQNSYNIKEVPEKISRPATIHLLTPQNIAFLKAIGLELYHEDGYFKRNRGSYY